MSSVLESNEQIELASRRSGLSVELGPTVSQQARDTKTLHRYVYGTEPHIFLFNIVIL
jgi:hypothetical protein